MALPIGIQIRYWGAAALAFVFILWALGDILLPFVLGGAIAYFLDPVADRLQRLGLGRTMATVAIFVASLLVVVAIALVVVPVLIQQTISLFNTAPQLFRDLQAYASERFPDLFEDNSALRQSIASIGETVKSRGGELLNTVLTSARSVIGVLLIAIITPVVAFYLLMDWDRLVARIDDMLPRDHADTIRQLAAEIDATLAGFIRGMGTVCLIMAAYYGIGLMAVGLQFGLAVGVFAGLITFIPYLGAILGGIIALGLALFQFWGDWLAIGMVALVFGIGQSFESYFMTPRLVGSSVGLHPVWLLLALSVFGALFGFVGLLVAVPIAAAIGVLTRFGVREYQQSQLYLGRGGGAR